MIKKADFTTIYYSESEQAWVVHPSNINLANVTGLRGIFCGIHSDNPKPRIQFQFGKQVDLLDYWLEACMHLELGTISLSQ
jgi:hypothetical protein